MTSHHFQMVGTNPTRRQKLRVVFFTIVALLIVGAMVAAGLGKGQLFGFLFSAAIVGLIITNLVVGRFGSRILFVLSNWIPVFANYAVALESWVDSPLKRSSTGVQSDVR